MRRHSLLILASVLVLHATFAIGAHATGMAKAHLPKKPFKIFKGHLSAEQQRCLRYALKQWVMYDDAPAADGKGNRNESNEHVTEAGPRHNMDDAIDTADPTKSHARSSRSMSAAEQGAMKKTYGDHSPFHADGQAVKDPVSDDSWFTDDEGSADVSIEPGDYIPGVDDKTLGLTRFALVDGTDEVGAKKQFKSRWADTTAILYIKDAPPGGKTWCYPTDTNHDGFITNADAKCPPNTIDYYMILKHELGHWFSFEHDDGKFELPDNPTPSFQPPASLCDSAMSAANDDAPDVAAGSEFGPRASRLYFASNRPGGLGGYDLWYVTWNSAEMRYKGPTNCGPVVNSPFNEIDPHPGVGDAELYFASDRPGGAGGYDLYRATRGSPSSWDSLAILPNVNTSANETGPCSFLGWLLYASDRPGGSGGRDLYASTFDAGGDPLPGANLGPAVNTPFAEQDPAVAVGDSAGPVQLLYASNRPGGVGGFDVYLQDITGLLAPATGARAGAVVASARLGSAVNLTAVNSPLDDTGPSADIRLDRLFLASNRPGGHGGMDCFASENHSPHPAVLWDGDAAALPGATAHLRFDVVNSGSAYALLQPVAYDSRGWGVTFNTTPFALQAGELRTQDVFVQVPPGTAAGDSSEVWYGTQVTGRGFSMQPQATMVLPFPANHAYAVALSATVTPPPATPLALALRAQPNPARGNTRFVVDIPRAGNVRIEVFDLLGRRVRLLHSGPLTAGGHDFSWDGHDDAGRLVRNGVFVGCLTMGGEHRRVKVVRRD